MNKRIKSQLKKIAGWYFLAIFGFTCSFLGLFLQQPWFFAGLIWWGIKLFFLQKKSMYIFCGFFLLLGILSGSVFYFHEKQQKELWKTGEITGILTVDPLSYQQKEDYFWGTGKLLTEKGKQKVRFSSKKTLKKIPVGSTLTLAITGELTVPKERENIGGFFEKDYLMQQGIYKKLQISKLQSVKITYPLQHILKNIVANLKSFLQHRLPESLSSFYQSTFLGVRDDFFYEHATTFSASGFWLFFSFSGLQFFFLLEGLKLLLLRLGITQETVKIFILIIGLLILATLGFKAHLFRGLLLSGLKVLPKNFFSPLDQLSLTLFFGQWLFPYQLVTFSGQVSYLVAFLWCCPIVKSRKLQSILLPFCIAPLFWWHLWEWSLFNYLTFVFLLPLMKKSLLASLIFLVPLLLNAKISNLVAIGYEISLDFLKQTHFFSINVGRPPLVVLFLFYGSALIFLFCFSKTQAKKYLLPLPILFFLGLNWSYLSPKGEITFINVRQGDSILLKAPFQREVYLIDTGGRLDFLDLKAPSIASQTLIPYLKFQGIKKIHRIFISHGDADHMGDLLEVVQAIPTEKILFQKGAVKQPLMAQTLQALPNTILFPIKNQEIFPFSKGKLVFLGPEKGEGSNEDSLHFLLELFERKFLFAGDAEKKGEQNFLQAYPHLKVDVLKISHHGSKTSTQDVLLEQLKPSYGVISCGVNNSYGHPAQEVIQRLQKAKVKILRTDYHGTISFIFTPQTFQEIKTLVSTEKK